MGVSNPYYQHVHMYVLNPKAVTIGELYGEVHSISNEWHDGLLGIIIRHACAVSCNFNDIIAHIIEQM
jgi:dynein heavy chain